MWADAHNTENHNHKTSFPKHRTVDGDGYHICAHIQLYHKHTYSRWPPGFSVSVCLYSSKSMHSHSFKVHTQRSMQSFIQYVLPLHICRHFPLKRLQKDAHGAHFQIEVLFVKYCLSWCTHPHTHTQAEHIWTALSDVSQETPYPCRKR